MSAAAVLCLGQRAKGKTLKYLVGMHAEVTFWPDLATAFKAAAQLAWPLCGPRCLDGNNHLLAWQSRDRFRVLDLSRLDQSRRREHRMRVLAELLAAGLYDTAADLANGDLSIAEAQKHHQQRRSDR